jgi:hypothetical protein
LTMVFWFCLHLGQWMCWGSRDRCSSGTNDTVTLTPSVVPLAPLISVCWVESWPGT